MLCYTWHHLRKNPVTCLRFFTVYGPRQRPEMAIHKFARAITDGTEIPFFGDGSSRRDYTYVDDIVTGVRAAMRREQGYDVFNLGGAATTSLSELVQQLEQALGKQAKRNMLPDQPGDVPITYADVGHAERELGYRCSTALAEGVTKFCTWYEQEKALGRLA